MRLSLIFAAFLFVSAPDMKVLADSPGLWPEVDTWVRQPGICDAIVDGGSYVFRHESCSAMGCDRWEYLTRTECGPMPGHADRLQATFRQWKDGQEFSRETIDDTSWSGIQGNLLRAKAAYAQSFGKTFTLESISQEASGLLRADYVIRSGAQILERGYWRFGSGPSVPQVRERHAIQYGFITEENSDFFVN